MKYLFSIGFNIFKRNLFLWSKLNLQHYYSVTWSSINHSNMLICCSRNTYYYYHHQCWKQLCCTFFLVKACKKKIRIFKWIEIFCKHLFFHFTKITKLNFWPSTILYLSTSTILYYTILYTTVELSWYIIFYKMPTNRKTDDHFLLYFDQILYEH